VISRNTKILVPITIRGVEPNIIEKKDSTEIDKINDERLLR